MELIQTVWTELTTPNAPLTNFLVSLLTILEMSMAMLLFTTILDIKASLKTKLVFVFSIAILSFISNNFLQEIPYIQFLHFFITLALIMVCFQTSFFKGIIAEILPLIVIALFEPFFVIIYTSIFSIHFEDVSVVPVYRISLLLLIYLVIFIIAQLSKKIHFNITFLDTIDQRNRHLLFINSFFGFIAIIAQLYLFKFYSENMPYLITAVSIIGLVAYFFISLYSLTKTVQLQRTQENLEESQLYNKSLKILHDNNRAFKHDFSNIVQAIGGYVSTGDIDGLQVYYSQLLEDCQKVNNLYGLSPDVINNPAIYSILASKYHKADELGIKINLDIFLNLNDLNMKIYEFTRILGILMDNAIEATCECEEKIINVEIRKDFKLERQLLIIENTYKDKDINIDKIYEKGFTSKPNNTGLGLWEVRQILKKNGNQLNLYTTKNTSFFVQQLEIYPPHKKLKRAR